MPLDIGIGLVLGVILSHVSGMGHALSLTLGVIACLLPDLDFVWQLIKQRALPDSSHRDGMHYPLLFIPTVGALGLIINPWVGLALAAGALIHFVHDSIGIGWGVKWLYPFKNVSYMFLYRATLPTNKDMPRKLMYSYTDPERNRAKMQYGDPKWISHIYFRPHIFGLVEYAMLVIGGAIALAS